MMEYQTGNNMEYEMGNGYRGFTGTIVSIVEMAVATQCQHTHLSSFFLVLNNPYIYIYIYTS